MKLERLIEVAVVLGTAAIAVAAFVFVDRYAGPAPVQDDFDFLGLQLVPRTPRLEHLLAPLNEHRLPLPRLTVWATARTFGFGLRTQMFVDLTMAVAAVVTVLASVRAIRGRWSLADLSIPAAYLSIGQHESLLWSVQVNFWLPVALVTVVLALLGRLPGLLTNGHCLGVSVCVLLLPLCGGQGVVAAAPVAVWLLAVGVAYRRTAGVLGGLAALALIASLIAYRTPVPHHPPPRYDKPALRYAVRVVGAAWGPVVDKINRADSRGKPTSALGVVTLVFVAFAGCRLVVAARRDPAARPAATGLLAVGAGLLAVATATGAGRAEINLGLIPNRYATLMMPLLVGMFLTFARFGPSRAMWVVAAGVALTFWPNLSEGLAFGELTRTRQAAIVADCERGTPPSFLAAHHSSYVYPSAPVDSVAIAFEALRAGGGPPFDRVPREPRLMEELVPLIVVSPDTDAEKFVVLRMDHESVWTITLPAGDFVGIKLRYLLRGGVVTNSQAIWDGWDGPRLVHGVFNEKHEIRLWTGGRVRTISFSANGTSAIQLISLSVYRRAD